MKIISTNNKCNTDQQSGLTSAPDFREHTRATKRAQIHLKQAKSKRTTEQRKLKCSALKVFVVTDLWFAAERCVLLDFLSADGWGDGLWWHHTDRPTVVIWGDDRLVERCWQLICIWMMFECWAPRVMALAEVRKCSNWDIRNGNETPEMIGGAFKKTKSDQK